MQFAYNEMSFFLVKLLQRFSSMELAPEAAPPESLPPAGWAVTGSSRKRIDRFWPKSHLTMYSHVSIWLKFCTEPCLFFTIQGGMWVKMTEAEDLGLPAPSAEN